MRRIVSAGAIGGVLEWYDFAIFGYFALEIGQAFFPRQDPVAQLLAAFGVFAVGYVMRPLGGLISGSIGDRLGRRAALAFSMATMAMPICTLMSPRDQGPDEVPLAGGSRHTSSRFRPTSHTMAQTAAVMAKSWISVAPKVASKGRLAKVVRRE